VELIFEDFIITKMRGSKDSEINNKPDTFYFNVNSKKYFSKRNLFNNYAKQEIKDFRWITTKPQIPANMLDDGNIRNGEGYHISLDSEWVDISSFVEDKLLKKRLTGTKFFNKSLNSSFTILEIPKGETGENFSLYNFDQLTTSKYKIRSTPIYTMGKNFNQLFEHSCSEKKYLLLFECPKNIYKQNKKMFDEIINSFFIEC